MRLLHYAAPVQSTIMPPARRLPAWVTQIPFAVWALLYVFIFGQICFFAVNVPFNDEWTEFPRQPVLPWLFSQHNEHRIVTTRIVIYVLWLLDGWNLAHQQILNFLLFGGLMLSLVAIARKFQPDLPSWVVFSFAIFTLSPINVENHVWAFCTQWHFVMLSLIWCAAFLFDSRQRPRELVAGTLCGLACIYSMASGITSILIILLGFAIFKTRRAAAAEAPGARRTEWLGLLAVACVLVAGLALYYVGFTFDTPPAKPVTLAYWKYFFLMLSSGFGALDRIRVGEIGLLWFLAPAALEFTLRHQSKRPAALWPLLLLPACLLVGIATTASGRLHLGLMTALANRYTEFTLVAVPLLATALWAALRDHVRWRPYVVGAFWLFCFVTYEPNWIQLSPSPDPAWQGCFVRTMVDRQKAVDQLHACYVQGVPCNTDLISRPITMDMLRQAEGLQLSFMDAVKAGSGDGK